MASTDALRTRLTELRRGFDHGFTLPAAEEVDDLLDLLLVRIGREPYALRLAQLGALEADRTITPVPSENTELLGIAGVRGTVVAVFDLASLLGSPRPESTRWIVLAKGAPLAFAFNVFDGQVGVRPDTIASAGVGRGALVPEVVMKDSTHIPLLDVPALVTSLEGRARRLVGEG
jgi:purine-binding chemotaxis protein CheW